MAGVSTKDIKLRIKSMESTKQITKAMEMVASSKLRKAQERVAASRPYFETLYDALASIAANADDFSSPYLRQNDGKRVCMVVIAGDRGLAGGYNSNVLKLAYQALEDREYSCVLPIGKKAVEFFTNRGIPLVTTAYAEVTDVSVGDCFTLAKLLAKEFLAGKYDEIDLAYTNFVSVLSQTPTTLKLLPLSAEMGGRREKSACLTLYEPDSVSVFDKIIPEYLGGLVYGALCEAVVSELGARRTAMDAATKNAEDMIDGLSLQYNRARQGAITQEITEIVAGADA